MKLGWRTRADVVLISALIGGASAGLPGYWLGWPSPARKASMIGVGWIVLMLGLGWAARAHDRPHGIVLFRAGGILRAGGSVWRLLEVVLVGAFLWLLLY